MVNFVFGTILFLLQGAPDEDFFESSRHHNNNL